jgi:hypothetical protein
VQKGRHGLAEERIAAGRVIVEERFIDAAIGEHFAHALTPEGLHLRDGRRLSTAEHAHIRRGGERFAAVVHELLNAAGAAEAGADV